MECFKCLGSLINDICCYDAFYCFGFLKCCCWNCVSGFVNWFLDLEEVIKKHEKILVLSLKQRKRVIRERGILSRQVE